jgi:hypothetical protein
MLIVGCDFHTRYHQIVMVFDFTQSFHRARRKAIPRQTSHLQVSIDIRYQYAIIVSLSRHDPLACPLRKVPCEPCAPAR